MATTFLPIDAYTVQYFTSKSSPLIAEFICTFQRSHKVTIQFFKSGAQVSDSLQGGSIQLQYHIEHFSRVYDILRNEKPLAVGFDAVRGFGWIYSGSEPVGEGE